MILSCLIGHCKDKSNHVSFFNLFHFFSSFILFSLSFFLLLLLLLLFLLLQQKNKADGDILLLRSDGTLVDGAGGVYSVNSAGLLVGPDGVIFGATGLIVTPSGACQNAAVSFADGAVLANGNGVAPGSKVAVKKQVDLRHQDNLRNSRR